MALKKWVFGTKLSTQITEQNANLTKIDEELTEQNASLTEIENITNNIKNISYYFIYDDTVTTGDFVNLIKNNWDKIPMYTSMLRFSANGYSGGGIGFKSSPAYGTVLILQNSRKPLVVQKSETTWNTYNWGA